MKHQTINQLSLPLFFFIQFAKLARDLDIPGGMRVASSGQPEAAPEGVSGGGAEGGAPTQLDDDELEGGLC